MKDFLEYQTGLTEFDPDLGAGTRVNGRGWSAELRRRTDGRYMSPAADIVILARSWLQAHKAQRLILAGYHLWSGHAPLMDFDDLAPWSDSDPASPTEDHPHFRRNTLGTDGIWQGCMVGAKASRRRSLQYAVTKYAFSQSLCSIHMADLEPYHGPHYGVSPYWSDHIRFAHAIVAAHSILEDLGLELRASAKRPSRINGQWNPEVKADLESRLNKAGIDSGTTVLWTLRGPRRRLDAKRPIPRRDKYRWARGMVRDCRVDLMDAIAHIDWLRDKVSSHAVSTLTTSLSAYDVVNAQHVARIVLLGVLRAFPQPRAAQVGT